LPAFIGFNGKKEWWIDGKRIKLKHYEKLGCRLSTFPLISLSKFV
jgi:hypothetical protein